jgi:hypothetical protein
MRTLWRYGQAVTAVLVAFWIGERVARAHLGGRLTALLMAVVVAALHGLGPALVAVVLGAFVTARLLPPEGSWWVEPGLPRIVFVGFVINPGPVRGAPHARRRPREPWAAPAAVTQVAEGLRLRPRRPPGAAAHPPEARPARDGPLSVRPARVP